MTDVRNTDDVVGQYNNAKDDPIWIEVKLAEGWISTTLRLSIDSAITHAKRIKLHNPNTDFRAVQGTKVLWSSE